MRGKIELVLHKRCVSCFFFLQTLSLDLEVVMAVALVKLLGWCDLGQLLEREFVTVVRF